MTPVHNPDAALADHVLGPRGTRAVPAGRWSSFVGLALLVVLSVALAVSRLGFCLGNGWHGKEPYFRQCYSELATGVLMANLGDGLAAFVSGAIHLDQPVLSATVMSAIGGLVGGSGTPGGGDLLTAQRWTIAVWALLAVALLVGMTRIAHLGPGHPASRPLVIATSPVVVLTVLISPDILGVALCTAGLAAWAWRRPALAGALLGAAVMARTYPLIALLAIAVLARRSGRVEELTRVWWGALAGAGVSALPGLASPELVLRPYAAWWSASTGFGSPWHLGALAGYPMAPSVATALTVTGWVVAGVLLAVHVLGSPDAPTPAAALLVAVAVVLVTGKSFPVQASLWLVPLVALAGLRWRDVLIWWAAEAAHFVAVWLYLSGGGAPSRGLPPGWYTLFLLARVGAVLWLAVAAWQPIEPESTPLEPIEPEAIEPEAMPWESIEPEAMPREPTTGGARAWQPVGPDPVRPGPAEPPPAVD